LSPFFLADSNFSTARAYSPFLKDMIPSLKSVSDVANEFVANRRNGMMKRYAFIYVVFIKNPYGSRYLSTP
jgi:hypothetical protein